MTFKVKKTGAFVDPAAVRRRSAGAWVNVGFVKVKKAGAWVQVWPISVLVSITDQSVFQVTSLNTTAAYILNTSGLVEKTLGTTTSTLETWRLSGLSADYEARATLVSGTPPSGSALATWLPLSTTRSWSLQDATADLASLTCQLTIEIRLASTLVVQDTATVLIESDKL